MNTTINQQPFEFDIWDDETAVDVIRDQVGLTGTKFVCGAGRRRSHHLSDPACAYSRENCLLSGQPESASRVDHRRMCRPFGYGW